MQDPVRPLIWRNAIRKRWSGTEPVCELLSCSGTRSLWQRVWRRQTGVFLQGMYYCQPQCVETALSEQLRRLERSTPKTPPASRIPLGLLMVARGRLRYREVAAALEAQQRARHGTIGEWIKKLGFATEQEVTSALGLQWGCPVASSLETTSLPTFSRIPLAILEAFQMLPLQYASTTQTLYLACGQRCDHAALYAIERIIGCRTQPCVGGPKDIAWQLERLRRQPRPHEVEFGPVGDTAEMSRISLSYITRVGADEVQAERVGPMIWLRLKSRASYTNLVFRLPSGARQEPAFTPIHRADRPLSVLKPSAVWPAGQ